MVSDHITNLPWDGWFKHTKYSIEGMNFKTHCSFMSKLKYLLTHITSHYTIIWGTRRIWRPCTWFILLVSFVLSTLSSVLSYLPSSRINSTALIHWPNWRRHLTSQGKIFENYCIFIDSKDYSNSFADNWTSLYQWGNTMLHRGGPVRSQYSQYIIFLRFLPVSSFSL